MSNSESHLLGILADGTYINEKPEWKPKSMSELVEEAERLERDPNRPVETPLSANQPLTLTSLEKILLESLKQLAEQNYQA